MEYEADDVKKPVVGRVARVKIRKVAILEYVLGGKQQYNMHEGVVGFSGGQGRVLKRHCVGPEDALCMPWGSPLLLIAVVVVVRPKSPDRSA